MANQYGLSSYASRLAAAAADPYHYDPTLAAATSRYPSASSLYTNAGTGYGGADGLSGSSLVDSFGVKRQLEALYHQNVLGTHNTIGQSDDLYSQNSLVKRPRYDPASHLPVYPQRPGEKDCTHYMLTRTCKFGENCKYDHPLWVPEGGIPDWKEVPVPTAEVLPERPGEPDCPYFLKTTKCKFGYRCKFNHPKDLLNDTCDVALLPDRPSEPICSFYAKTGKCKFGGNCIFHHPKDIQISQSITKNSESKVLANANAVAGGDLTSGKIYAPPALLHNSKGLPIRIGEQDCPFYLKTGSCKYGPTCRYNHPDRPSIPSVDSALANSLLQNHAVLSAAASLLPNIDPRLTQTTLGAAGAAPIIYPQRPGELECDYYMKNGLCKFGDRCKFHHPIDRTMSSVNKQEPVKFTLAGLPRREGAIMCPFYMKTGICKFGATCKYDHPPPGEVMSTNQSVVDTDGNAVDDPLAQ